MDRDKSSSINWANFPEFHCVDKTFVIMSDLSFYFFLLLFQNSGILDLRR